MLHPATKKDVDSKSQIGTETTPGLGVHAFAPDAYGLTTRRDSRDALGRLSGRGNPRNAVSVGGTHEGTENLSEQRGGADHSRTGNDVGATSDVLRKS
jgi:hypothetical protein